MRNCRWPSCEAMLHLLSAECLSMVVMPSNLWLILYHCQEYFPTACYLAQSSASSEMNYRTLFDEDTYSKPTDEANRAILSIQCGNASDVTQQSYVCNQCKWHHPESKFAFDEITWVTDSGNDCLIFMYSDAIVVSGKFDVKKNVQLWETKCKAFVVFFPSCVFTTCASFVHFI